MMKSTLSPSPPPAVAAAPLADAAPVLARRAWSLIQAQRFGDAVEMLQPTDGDDSGQPTDPATAVPLRLARNLVALQVHRPRVLRRVLRAGIFAAMQRYPLATTPAGFAVPSKTRSDGSTALLTAGPDPIAGARQTLQQLGAVLASGEPIALADLLDGHLLSALAASPPDLLLTMQQPIEIVEPKTHLLIACLMLHDWSGDDGPIAAPRFSWYIGPNAFEEYGQRLVNESMLLPPRVVLGRSRRSEALQKVIARGNTLRRQREDNWQRRIDEHYADFRPDALTVGTSRRPKVLLLTCRFTTVLQHSIADCEAAFKKLGWRTRVLIEPSDTHRMSSTAVTQALATFRPDLVFTIDALRQQTQLNWPDKLPYVCWIQDQLDRLTTPEAGASITPHDFVLSMVRQMYTRQWGYPDRQMIDMPKLTRPPVLPERWASDGPDLTYVSSASQTLDELLAPLAHHPLLSECGRRVAATYDAGDALPTLWHVGQIVDDVCRKQGRRLSTGERVRCVNALFHPLNNALYRQQALRWVAAAADELQLDFALHGPGWDRHAELARFARGPISYGPDLEELTRASKINLQIIPSLCLHQRMLDGLVAGGFFLVRQHPNDHRMPRLLAALDADSQTVDQALAAAGDNRPELEAALADAECFTDLGMPIDVVGWMREAQRADLMNRSGQLLPELDAVTFHDAASLKLLVQRYVDDPAARQHIARQQRESVQHRLSYTAGLRRALARIGRLLAETAAHDATRATVRSAAPSTSTSAAAA